jgi:hypothetical protein
LVASPNFVIHRTAAAPVGADVADPAFTNAAILEATGFQDVAIMWTAAGGADADTLTFRVLFLDERTVGLVPAIATWLRSPPYVRHFQERIVVPVLGARMFVRIDAFSNAALNLQIHAAGVKRVTSEVNRHV